MINKNNFRTACYYLSIKWNNKSLEIIFKCSCTLSWSIMTLCTIRYILKTADISRTKPVKGTTNGIGVFLILKSAKYSVADIYVIGRNIMETMILSSIHSFLKLLGRTTTQYQTDIRYVIKGIFYIRNGFIYFKLAVRTPIPAPNVRQTHTSAELFKERRR